MSEIQSEGEMTFDQAKSAIEDAVTNDPGFNPQGEAGVPEPAQPTVPDQADQPTPGEELPDPGDTSFDSAEADESFMGGDFNPDLLPDELKPGFKQLQGRWTQKTQELAEQRKVYEELQGLGDPEELRQAAEFYSALQDPEYLRNFYGELGNVVREMGLVDEPAAPEPVEPQVAPVPPELAQIAASDPELSPFVDRFAQMEQRLASFEAQAAQEREYLAEERAMMAEAANIDQQVQAVREAHPNWKDEDWDAVYDRAIAFDGDVLRGADAYEADRSRIIAEWNAQKQAVPASVSPQAGAGTVTEDQGDEPQTLDQAHRAAEAFLNANDLTEFTG